MFSGMLPLQGEGPVGAVSCLKDLHLVEGSSQGPTGESSPSL